MLPIPQNLPSPVPQIIGRAGSWFNGGQPTWRTLSQLYWKRYAIDTRLSILGNNLLEHINGQIRLSEDGNIDNRLDCGDCIAHRATGAKPVPDLRGTQLRRLVVKHVSG